MSAELTLPASELAKFTQSMHVIAQASGVAAEEVLKNEAGVILKQWAGRTKVATEKKALIRARTRAATGAGVSKHGSVYYGTTINTGRKGGTPGVIWFRTRRKKYQQAGMVRDDGSYKFSWLHYAKEGWEDIKYKTELYAKALAIQMKYAKKTIGLGRQSVVQIADRLGINLNKVRGGGNLSARGIQKARDALASNGYRYSNGSGAEYKQGSRYFIELLNNYPRNQKIGMDATLAGVIAGRVKYFENNMERGVFLAQAKTAAAYPWLKVAA